MKIDLNCDCGESYGPWQMGDDEELLSHVTSANVACGGHAGDPRVMQRTVRLARDRGVAVGAHPGYPDLLGFGRRTIAMTRDELVASVLAQIGALYAIARAEKVALTHVKPHGALYNQAAIVPAVAEAIAYAVASFSHDLILVGLAGSLLVEAGQAAGLRVAREAFADRTYEPDGTLRDRSRIDAIIKHDDQMLSQVVKIVKDHVVMTRDGIEIPIVADTICIHGDTPGAARRAAFLRAKLVDAHIEVAPMCRII